MKNNFYLLIAAVYILFSASCQTQSRQIGEINQKTPSININTPNVLIKPVIADLDISQDKKTSIYEADLDLNQNQYLANAKSKFMIDNNCDVIINPQIRKITNITNSNINKITYEVKGFPATFNKIYQTEELNESIHKYNTMNVDVNRENFIYEDKNLAKGSEIYLSLGYGNMNSVEIGYFPTLEKSIYYFGSFETYEADAFSLDFDLIGSGFTNTVNSVFSMNTFALGAGYQMPLNKFMNSSIFGGLNITQTNFSNAYETNNLRIEGFNFLGLRAGIQFDQSIYRNMSWFAKGFANINLLPILNSSKGDNIEYSNVTIDNGQLINYAAGLRFKF